MFFRRVDMALIPMEALPYFEHMIYLPMVLVILKKDRLAIESGTVKLKKPYVKIIDEAIKNAQNELKIAKRHLHENHMDLTRGKSDDTFTEYIFFYKGYEEQRRYLNVRLRNRTEELLTHYFTQPVHHTG